MTEIDNTVPNICPKPHAWGQFKNPKPLTYFFICDFVNMTNKVPDLERFISKVSELHLKSKSPTGQFGFHLPVCHGPLKQSNEWNPSWCSFFTELFVDAARQNLEVNDVWPEFNEVCTQTIERVIPRLIGALEINGRTLRPCFIHGDLWEGNTGTDGSGKIYIFDAGGYYAHNEMELGMWRCRRHKLNEPKYRKAYFQKVPISEPIQEVDDRNRLYSIREDLVHSTCHKGAIERSHACADMLYLIEKYAPWNGTEDKKPLEALKYLLVFANTSMPIEEYVPSSGARKKEDDAAPGTAETR